MNMKKKLNFVLDRLFKQRLVSTRPLWRLDLYPENDRPRKPRYLNVGAGMWYHPLWHNLDNPVEGYGKSHGFEEYSSLLIRHDLMSGDPLPVEDGSLRAIYSSHTIEHLAGKAVEELFMEAHRTLEPGGVIRIVCPDMNLFVDAYSRGDESFLAFCNNCKPGRHGIEQLFLNMFASALSEMTPDCGVRKMSGAEFRRRFSDGHGLDFLDRILAEIPTDIAATNPQHHSSWYNEDKLMRMLKDANFSKVYPSRYGQSKFEPMRDTAFFDHVHPFESLYVEAMK